MCFLHARLQKVWNLNRGSEFINIENDYYSIWFWNLKDYNYVLQKGPWLIVDHYLIGQCWKPNFDLFINNIPKMTIWERILGLPIEFYNKHFSWRVGNRIGKSIKVLLLNNFLLLKTDLEMYEIIVLN